ncbi:MAG: type II toxin-antitoxin system HicB family antitoxin [Clostridia bacterium]|nr:type II toxin-antitoxin system HicB family antitoxin [Deltaproteobacteria bacterium]
MLNRKLKYFMRLQYPATIVVLGASIVGALRDLPGCAVSGDSVSEVYVRLDEARRLWIRDRLLAGGDVPLPNSANAVATETDWNDSALARAPRELEHAAL